MRTFTTSDGTRLVIEETGEPDAPVTVLLLHAWTLSRRTWARVAQLLPEEVGGPVRVLRYDHRGHGDSAAPEPGSTTIAHLADDLAEVLTEVVPTGPVVLAGHSIGGMTIMALAERHPELFAARVAGVEFVNTSSGDLGKQTPGVPAPVARAMIKAQLVHGQLLERRGVRKLGPPALLRPYLRWLLFGVGYDRVHLRETSEIIAGSHPLTLHGFLSDVLLHDRAKALAVLSEVPVVVLTGGRDRLTPPEHSRVIAEQLPRAELVIYPGAGHMVPVERSREAARHLAGMVRSAVPVG
ncbi:alpha/beta hydrolase [Allokutzneria sp. A3M-2-11 16]|uniref:alpha/beta fold hydrolase n=1 Tax=Allokutzneria sp. A3M-2-11 16 TaxID=2962043 RepID=UPI0020B8CA1A|nr:alpha/beta hydrolase [Allokutzneria sp. A3M-2-11 16]MCP3798554.1 alpha/beta hydrolase [Allokutzneria sp. A3M-2-11 16]